MPLDSAPITLTTVGKLRILDEILQSQRDCDQESFRSCLAHGAWLHPVLHDAGFPLPPLNGESIRISVYGFKYEMMAWEKRVHAFFPGLDRSHIDLLFGVLGVKRKRDIIGELIEMIGG
jgi:hypothetical protein